MRFSSKTAIITGSARGMGAAEALLLASEGASVAVCDVLEAEGIRVAEDIAARGGTARFFNLDISSERRWIEVAREVTEWSGGIDVLINNAGIINRTGIEATTSESWNRLLSINLTGAFLGMKTVAPYMRARRGGAIVNIASNTAFTGHSDAAYTAAKWALRGLGKSAAMEFVDAGIRVNTVCPGLVVTGINRGGAHLKPVTDMTPMRRAGTPEEVAKLVAFLASSDASYITGEDFLIDGGFTAGASYRRVAQETAEPVSRGAVSA